MLDYVAQLRADLVEQFKNQPVIDALIEAVGEQLIEVRGFYEDLRNLRSLETATGKQLDGIGDIVVLSRTEAGELACYTKSVYVLEDEDYRDYLKHKIWKNNCNCTYADVIKGFRMFWDKPLYYSESVDEPATMIFDAGAVKLTRDIVKLMSAPIIKAAGVGLKIQLHPEDALTWPIYIGGVKQIKKSITVYPQGTDSEEVGATWYVGIATRYTDYVDLYSEKRKTTKNSEYIGGVVRIRKKSEVGK